MNQIGLHEEWLEFLENYVMPLQEAAFLGYASEVGLFFFSLGMFNLPPACIPLEVFELPNNEFFQNLACTYTLGAYKVYHQRSGTIFIFTISWCPPF